MKTSIIIFLVILSFVNIYSETSKLRLALLDFDTKGIDKLSSIKLSDCLRTEIKNIQAFSVIKKDFMLETLNTNKFNKSKKSNDIDSLIEIGKILNVDRIIAGSIKESWGFYSILLQIFDVNSGKLLFIVNKDYDCSINELLSKHIKKSSIKLVLGSGTTLPKKVLGTLSGEILISSNPSGANIKIDGKPFSGKTPITIKGVLAGEHILTVNKDDFYGSKKILLKPDGLLEVAINMSRAKGSLKVISNLDGVDVYLNDIKVGITPCVINDILVGQHVLSMKSSFSESYSGNITVDVNSDTTIDINLKEIAYISVKTLHRYAGIFINGELLGSGRLNKYKIAVGELKLEVKNLNYETYSTTFILKKDDHKSFDIALKSLYGKLNIITNPKEATIFINETWEGSTDYQNNIIQPGNYRLRLVLKDYKTILETIKINPGDVINRSITFKHTTAYLDSIKEKNNLLHYKRKLKRRIIFTTSAIVTTAIGIYYNKKSLDAYAAYNPIFKNGNNNYDESWKLYENEIYKRNISYVLSAIFVGGFAISIPF